jgi:biotin-dependent carboxylase-like uncharacterized protein
VIEVIAAGPLTTVQDLGRPGYAFLGVPPSGAADRGSLVRANRLVGNPDGAAALEVTFGGLWFRATASLTVAVTGAPCAARMNAAWPLEAGEEVRLGTPSRGLRSYVAVRGGLDVRPELGSRSTDVLSGLGPAALRRGDVIPIGGIPIGGIPVGHSVAGDASDPPGAGTAAVLSTVDEPVTVPVTRGPRADWFTDEAWQVLVTAEYQVGMASNRIGIRLEGPPLARRVLTELPSEGLVRGAVQVASGGQPILFLADHPVTGGYPVIAVATSVDAAAQARPGSTLRFIVDSTRRPQ